jgi:hypothetical protein
MLPYHRSQSIIQFKIPLTVWATIALAMGVFVAGMIMLASKF